MNSSKGIGMFKGKATKEDTAQRRSLESMLGSKGKPPGKKRWGGEESRDPVGRPCDVVEGSIGEVC